MKVKPTNDLQGTTYRKTGEKNGIVDNLYIQCGPLVFR